jgi:hypothetical protein
MLGSEKGKYVGVRTATSSSPKASLKTRLAKQRIKCASTGLDINF